MIVTERFRAARACVDLEETKVGRDALDGERRDGKRTRQYDSHTRIRLPRQ